MSMSPSSNAMQTRQTPRFSVAIQTKGYQDMINNTLKDPKRQHRYVAAITSAVATNPALQECDAATILAGSLLGESLNFAHSPQLGQYYLVPFDDKRRGCKVAQFIMGYRGFLQLAIRSGKYKRINVLPIKQGELKHYSRLTGEIEVEEIQDDIVREATPTMGYYAMFELTDGFRKEIYWSYEKMLAHADRYSAAFSAVKYKELLDGKVPERDLWKYSSFWYKDFDAMACKTMLRQLISKWGVMSIELQQAFDADGYVVSQDKNGEFVADTSAQLSAEIEERQGKAASQTSVDPEPQAEVIDLNGL
nr:MAG TPA: RecT protein [Caudoviricetes sp.]